MGRGRRPHAEVPHHEIERVFQVHFFLHDRETLATTDSATLIVTTDNRLLYAQHGTVATRRRLLTWAIHVMNFLSSPSVKLSYQPPPEAVQKKRQRSGKEPLPGWFAMVWRHVVCDDTRDNIGQKKLSHRSRCRVRGHCQHVR